ncbi:GNAT family protein [Clostridium sp.]|uniref:GNAT family N-acetyltransferase n=1 Tax=Clostridium sp. TaxID=1506 RepID=UPI003216496A
MHIKMVDKKYHGKEFGKIAMKNLIDIVFKKYRVNTIYLSIVEGNIVAYNLYKSIGAGAIVTNFYDLCKWYDCLKNRKFLSDKTYDLFFQENKIVLQKTKDGLEFVRFNGTRF